VECELGRINVDPAAGFFPAAGDSVRVMLRPEWLRMDERGADAVVGSIAYAGHDALVSFELASGAVVRARIAAPDLPRRGAEATIAVRRPALAFPQP
jgi:iron(III) transport system ATP-binding protein